MTRLNGPRLCTSIASLAVLFIGVMLIGGYGCKKPTPKPKGVIISIKSEPSGTLVTRSGKSLGTTPTKLRGMPGKYIFKFSKEGYHEKWQRVVIPNTGTKEIDVELKPVTGTIMIKTTPPGAKVEINGKIVGETPIFLKNQAIGQHKGYLRRLNYVSKEISWEIKDARPKMIAFELISNIGTLKINSTPEGANIKIDGNNRGMTPFETKIEQGTHKLEIERTGYALYKEVVTVERDKTKEVGAELQILPGSIKVSTNPPGATLFINDKQYENTPTEVKDLKPGVYKIKLTKPAHDPYFRTVDVLPGRKVELDVKLDSNTGGIDLVVHPSGVTVYLDGKKIGVTKAGENSELSEVYEIRDISMGKHKIQVSHKRALPPDIIKSIRVPKGGVKRVDLGRMWIADTEIVLKDGTKYRGRLRSDNKKRHEIMLEFVPQDEMDNKKYSKITQRFGYDEIEKRRALKNEE